MGAGASAESLTAKVSASSVEDITKELSALSEADKSRVKAAVLSSTAGDDWALKAEAERIFKLADKDGSGSIDMAELANVRNSEKFAEAMMDTQDGNADGKLSLAEWLAYVKSIFDKKESACKAVLDLYEKQIGQDKKVD